MLDRLLIARTKMPTREEIRAILEIRAEAEDIKLSSEALKPMTDIGEKYSLRHASQLTLPAKLIAETECSDVVKPEYVERAKSVFIDVRESVSYLKQELERDFSVNSLGKPPRQPPEVSHIIGKS